MKFNFTSTLLLGLTLPTLAVAADFEDFNQDWMLFKTHQGKCSPAISLRHSEFFGRDSLIIDRNFANSSAQQIYQIGEEISGNDKYTTVLNGQVITITRHKKPFLARKHRKLIEKQEFTLGFPYLSYRQFDGKGNVLTSCEYQVRDAGLTQAPSSCALYLNGEEIKGSSCTFVTLEGESEDPKQACEISTSVMIEDTINQGKYDVRLVFRNLLISGVKRDKLNLSNEYRVSYTVDETQEIFGDDQTFTLDQVATFVPAYNPEVSIHNWTDESNLSVRCK